MSPTIFRYKGYRFFFFSREESRIHVHVSCAGGEAKFWLEPIISLSKNYGLTSKILRELEEIIQEKENDIKNAWEKHSPHS